MPGIPGRFWKSEGPETATIVNLVREDDEMNSKETSGKDIDRTLEELKSMNIDFSQIFHLGPGTAKESIEEICERIAVWYDKNSEVEGRKLDFVCFFRVADSMEKDDDHVRAIMYGDVDILRRLFKNALDMMNKEKGDKLNILLANT